MASIWHQGRWQRLDVGLGYQKFGAGPEIGFAQEWTSKTQRPLDIVKVHKPGASLWGPYNPYDPGEKFAQLVEGAQAALLSGEHRLCGLIWFQGEADARREDDATAYHTRFLEFLNSLRSTLAVGDFPVVTALLSTSSPRFPYFEQINTAFQTLQAHGVRTIDTIDCPKRADGVHFTYNGLFQLGARAANELRR